MENSLVVVLGGFICWPVECCAVFVCPILPLEAGIVIPMAPRDTPLSVEYNVWASCAHTFLG